MRTVASASPRADAKRARQSVRKRSPEARSGSCCELIEWVDLRRKEVAKLPTFAATWANLETDGGRLFDHVERHLQERASERELDQ